MFLNTNDTCVFGAFCLFYSLERIELKEPFHIGVVCEHDRIAESYKVYFLNQYESRMADRLQNEIIEMEKRREAFASAVGENC